MIYQIDRNPSTRHVVQILQTVLLVVGCWIVFRRNGNETRECLIAICFTIVYLRLTFTLFFLMMHSMGWVEALAVPFACAVYYVGFALLGRNTRAGVGAADIARLVLFAAGSIVNTLSETLRNRWKRRPENNRRIYPRGLFEYAVHINYFADVLWVLGIALVTRNLWSLAIPVALLFFFAFYNGPLLDLHMAQRYGKEFTQYATRTARIIPFIW